MNCPYCDNGRSRVIDTTHDARGGIRRRRECLACSSRYSTYERPILSVPFIKKNDGTREEFDRDKLFHGIRISCTKRPVSEADIDRLVGEIEASLHDQGKKEISSRMIGDMVMEKLIILDQIAYIRFAIVYLGFEDLSSIRNEINKLLENT